MQRTKLAPSRAWMLSLGLLAGCAASGPLKTYEGPARPAAELATLAVPEEVQVMAIDGREPPTTFARSDVQMALLPGEHVLSLRYVQLFQLGADSHEIVRSKQAALRFNAAAGAAYRLESPHQAKLEQGKAFAKDPKFRLVNAGNGEAVDSVSITSYAEASLVDTINKAFQSQGEPRTATNLDLLKDVWGRTSPEERDAFRRWLDQQGK